MNLPRSTRHGLITLQVQAVLRHAAQTKSFIRYQDLCKSTELFTAALVAVLNALMEDDHRGKRPLTSSLVVSSAKGFPGKGYFEKARALGYDFEDDLEFWHSQCAALFGVAEKIPRCCLCGKALPKDGSLTFRIVKGFQHEGFVYDSDFGSLHESCFNRAFPTPDAALAEIRKMVRSRPA